MFKNGFTSAKVFSAKKRGTDKIDVDVSNFGTIRNIEDEEKSKELYNHCFNRMVKENEKGEVKVYVPIDEKDLKYSKNVVQLFKQENIFAKQTYEIHSDSDGECYEPSECRYFMYLCWKGNSYKDRVSLFCNKGTIDLIRSLAFFGAIIFFICWVNITGQMHK